MKTTLFTNMWAAVNGARYAELTECLRRNAENPEIDRIVVLDQLDAKRREDFAKYRHIEWVDIPIAQRPTFRRYFDEVNAKTTTPFDLNIVANSDVYFDESIRALKTLDMEGVCVALSRWEAVPGRAPELKVWDNSQDAWMFRGRVKPMGWTGFGMGIWGCDNRLAWELARTGYRLVNPCRDIRSYHRHDSGVRNNQSNVGGPTATVARTDLSGAKLLPLRKLRYGCVAYSLWGEKPQYVKGMLENVLMCRFLYPGWTCRVYHDDTVSQAVLDELFELRAERVRMPRSVGASGMFWRSLAAVDPGYYRTIVRDADSRPTYRERRAVDEWVASDVPFHRMRDHPWHKATVHGGMWGMLNGTVPDLALRIEQFQPRTNYGDDERFLGAVVWPLVKTRAMTHANGAERSTDGLTRPFPVEIEDWRFVGERVEPGRGFSAMNDRSARMNGGT